MNVPNPSLCDRYYAYLNGLTRPKTADFAHAEVLYRLGHGQHRKPTPKPWRVSASTAGNVRRALDAIRAEWDAERAVSA